MASPKTAVDVGAVSTIGYLPGLGVDLQRLWTRVARDGALKTAGRTPLPTWFETSADATMQWFYKRLMKARLISFDPQLNKIVEGPYDGVLIRGGAAEGQTV
jgi:hypothetical protein